jgi:carbon storage regulator
MLILSRKPDESIVIDGRIVVKIIRVDGDTVKVGIEAPPDVPIHRREIYDEIQLNNRNALTKGKRIAPKLSTERSTLGPLNNPIPAGAPV